MLSPQGEAAANGGLSDPVEAPPDAMIERLKRRTAALERQLQARIDQVEDLQRRLAHHEKVAAAATEEAANLRREVEALRPRAAELEALMNTVTMRALGRPRAWYGEARRLLERHGRR
jgi:chromosome segregation ATPase